MGLAPALTRLEKASRLPGRFEFRLLPFDRPNDPRRGWRLVGKALARRVGAMAPLQRLSASLDLVNQKFGKNKVYLASLEGVRDRAQEKIAFDKTWLFSEGKDDNAWPDTFRGADG